MTAGDARTRRLIEDLRAIDLPQLPEFISLLQSEAASYSRYHYTPGHITGSAFVVHPSAPSVALVHHDKLDMWVQPGGHIEPDDTSVEAGARREVAEEIGLDRLEPIGPVDIDIHTFPARGDQPTHLHYDVRYAFRSPASSLRAGDGVREAAWIGVDEAIRMDESVARAVRRIARLAGW